MIFTFEGAPSVGKITVTEELKKRHACYLVLLFLLAMLSYP
jgi:hypothetical protein